MSEFGACVFFFFCFFRLDSLRCEQNKIVWKFHVHISSPVIDRYVSWRSQDTMKKKFTHLRCSIQIESRKIIILSSSCSSESNSFYTQQCLTIEWYIIFTTIFVVVVAAAANIQIFVQSIFDHGRAQTHKKRVLSNNIYILGMYLTAWNIQQSQQTIENIHAYNLQP